MDSSSLFELSDHCQILRTRFLCLELSIVDSFSLFGLSDCCQFVPISIGSQLGFIMADPYWEDRVLVLSGIIYFYCRIKDSVVIRQPEQVGFSDSTRTIHLV